MARAIGDRSGGDNVEFVSAKQAARILSVHPNTLCKLRMSGGGPPYVKVGRRVRYRISEISAWADEHTYVHTAQYPHRKQAHPAGN